MGPKLSRACSQGYIIDWERNFGNLRNGVGQHFGTQALAIMACEVPMVGSIGLVWGAGSLIGLRKENGFEELFLAEA